MTTQITATQSNFANQTTEIASPPKNKIEPVEVKKTENAEQSATLDFTQLQGKVAAEKATEKDSGAEDPEVIQAALDVISDFMQLASRNINFQQDANSDKTVIKFFDSESKELIKQFPSEEILEIAHKIVSLRQDVGEKTGIFLEEKV